MTRAEEAALRAELAREVACLENCSACRSTPWACRLHTAEALRALVLRAALLLKS